MRKIKNPFPGNSSDETYNCFGCSPANDAGLHLEFWLDGEELIAKWEPKKHFEGWIGVLHGGIQGTLLDEVAAWLVFVVLKTAGVTTEMNVKYLKPALIDNGQITVRASLISFEKRLARIRCNLEDGNGLCCATSEITYYCFPPDVAKAKYNYPGIEAFIDL